MPPARGTVPFCFVDVFARRPLTGNPLSLIPDADGLAEAQLQAIAREFNQSETTFVLRPSVPGATYRLRSFTPLGAEVFGAGHNARGAWLWLAHADRLPAAGPLTQEIGSEVLPVEVSRGHDGLVAVTMAQAAPRFGGGAGGGVCRGTGPSCPPRWAWPRRTWCRTSPPRWWTPGPGTCWCRCATGPRWTGP